MNFEQLVDSIAELPTYNLLSYRRSRPAIHHRTKGGEFHSQVLTLKLVKKRKETSRYVIEVTSSGISKGVVLAPRLIPPFNEFVELSFTIYLAGYAAGVLCWWKLLDPDIVKPLYLKLQAIQYDLNHPQKAAQAKAKKTMKYHPSTPIFPRKAQYSLDKYDGTTSI